MASALWLGSMEPQWLAPFLSLPVQVMVMPEMMVPVLPGQRFFTPSDDRETITAAISGRDIYYLSVTNWESVVIPANHGRLLALGQVPPPPGSPVGFLATPPDEQYPALCRLLPPAEPETLYIAGGEVRCSVWEEDYLPLLERLVRL